MYKRILTTLSVIFLGSMLLASNEGVTKKSINNDNVLSIENNVDLKQIESIGVSARNSIVNKLDESLIVNQSGLIKKYKDINELHLYISELKSFKQSLAQKNKLANKISENRDHCEEGYVDDCADDDCCPESWVGDGFADCEDQAYGCDLTCYDNDGGDCDGGTDGGTTGGTESCDDCELDWSAYGSECCDTAWDEFGIDCATLEGTYGWDCAGCACPGDGPAECGDGNCTGDETYETCPDDCNAPGECDAGLVPDCADDDCCPESWIGDGFADCEDQAYGCDLTCYDNDGGD